MSNQTVTNKYVDVLRVSVLMEKIVSLVGIAIISIVFSQAVTLPEYEKIDFTNNQLMEVVAAVVLIFLQLFLFWLLFYVSNELWDVVSRRRFRTSLREAMKNQHGFTQATFDHGDAGEWMTYDGHVENGPSEHGHIVKYDTFKVIDARKKFYREKKTDRYILVSKGPQFAGF
jgi:hypothetical protein